MAADEVAEEMRFETAHTACAAYLVYCGLQMDEVIWEGYTCSFLFENTKELQEEFRKFVAGEARVEPQQYSNTFGQVTRQMREHPSNPRKSPRRR